MQSTIEVIKPAQENALVTLYEAKASLRLADTTSSDDLLDMLIRWSSGEIATLCNRVFGRETVIETFREIDAAKRVFLSRYPVAKITSVMSGGAEFTGYELDRASGRLYNIDGTWSEPVIVSYTGGYDLPFESPLGLRRASLLFIRDGYYAAQRGDASIRMVSHKESRVIYFDPNQAAKSAGAAAGGGTSTQRAAADLLEHFIRVQV